MTHIKCNVINCSYNTDGICAATTITISGTSCHTYKFDAVKMSKQPDGVMRVVLKEEVKI